MPEGDTIHKLAGYLRPRLEGRLIDTGVARLPERKPLAGRRIRSVAALGKHLLIAFDDGALLRTHLGMWGAWHRYAVGEPWRRPERQAVVELCVEGNLYVCFGAQQVEWLRSAGLRHRVLAAQLGPDLVSGDADYATILQRAREILDPTVPLVDCLLDQRIAAGIGNVYKSEVLFLEHRHPLTRLAEIDDSGLEQLYRHARALLRSNLGGGPRVTRPGPGNGPRLWVYRRRAEPCLVCNTPVTYARLGVDQRATYWCATCQIK